MKLNLVIIGLVALGLISCNANNKSSDKAAQKEQHIKDSIAACSADTVARETLNPNGETALALLMRKMDDDLANFKTTMKKGEVPVIAFDHAGILTAEPTKKEIKGDEDYKAYANSYLIGLDNLKNAEVDSIPAKHNHLVNKCIECHRVFCTGPITRIKKLLVNPKNIDFTELD